MNYQDYFSSMPTADLAKDLLGRPFSYFDGQERLGGYIVEAEAYLGKQDRAAHSYAGRRSQANEGLYGPPGTIYIYSQRQYFFFDVAAQAKDEPQGILIRAIEPAFGLERMIQNRGKDGVLLTNGPAKLMLALGVNSRAWDCQPLSQSPFAIDLDPRKRKAAKQLIAAPRIGINQSDPFWASQPLRFFVAGNPYVSDMKKRDYDPNRGWL